MSPEQGFKKVLRLLLLPQLSGQKTGLNENHLSKLINQSIRPSIKQPFRLHQRAVKVMFCWFYGLCMMCLQAIASVFIAFPPIACVLLAWTFCMHCF